MKILKLINSKYLKYLLLGFLILLTFFRVGKMVYYAEEYGVDFQYYINMTSGIVNGVDIYDVNEFQQYFPGKKDPPLCPPTMVLFLLPLLLFAKKYQFLVFSIISVCSLIFTIRFFSSYFGNRINVLIGILLYFNTIPSRMVLGNGQIGIIVLLCLSLAFFSRYFFIRGLMMGIALALKFSLTLPFYFLFFILKAPKETILSLFIVFLSIIFPLFFDIDLIKLYKNYIDVIQFSRSSDGWTSFASNEPWLIELSFFKNIVVNFALKCLITVATLYAIVKSKKITIEIIVLIGCSTLLLSYHRIHDMVLIVPFLLIYCFEKKIVPIGAICFMLLPYSIILNFANIIGSFMIDNQWIYLSKYTPLGYHSLFPIEAVFMFFLSIYIYIIFLRFNKHSQFM